MTATTDFIAELFRAANEVGKLGAVEKRRLLVRAVATIRDMRVRTGMRRNRKVHDRAVDLLKAAIASDGMPDDKFADALLEAASMIRTLKILLDAKDEVQRGG